MASKKPLKSVFKTNVIYGVLVLVPTAVILLLLIQIVEILEKTAAAFNLESTTSFILTALSGLLLLLIICFVIGAFVRTRVGTWSLERLERTILAQIPGYAIISNVLKGFAEKKIAYHAAMIELYGPGASVLGFIMEDGGDGRLTVFVPSTPMLTVGSLYVVDRERVTILEAGSIDVTNCITQWGIGLQEMLTRGKPKVQGAETNDH